jgi:hypothetical protein
METILMVCKGKEGLVGMYTLYQFPKSATYDDPEVREQ